MIRIRVMRKSAVLGLFFGLSSLFLGGGNAAAVPCSVPNTLLPNTLADATKVMANFNALVTCINNLTLPMAVTNATLQTFSTAINSTVMRTGFYTSGDTPPLVYEASFLPCTLNSGLGNNGSQVPSANNTCWIANFPAGPLDARWFGAKGDGATDDTTPLQAIANLGKVAGGNDLTYRISTALTCPVSNAGWSHMKLYGAAANFSNTVLANKYTATAAFILCQGQIVSPFTAIDNITVENLILQSEVADSRLVDAIAIRNVSNPTIRRVEAYGFPVGVAVRGSTLTGKVEIASINCHDWTTNVNWTAQSPNFPQITCVEIDNDVVNSVNTTAPVIDDIRCKDLTFGATAITNSGYQTDCVNLAKKEIKFARTTRIYADTIGEGVDNFSVNGTFGDIVIKNAYYYGIKNIHGASYNNWGTVAVEGAGIACAGFFGGAFANVEGNLIDGFSCKTVNQNGTTGAGSTDSCVLFNDNAGPFLPSKNTVREAVCTPGALGDYNFVDISTGSENSIVGRSLAVGRTATGLIATPANNNTIRSSVPTQLLAGLTNVQTITTGASTKIAFNAIPKDTLTEWNAAGTKWIAKFPGTYRVNGAVRFPLLNTGKTMSAFIYKNGALALGFQQDYAEAEAHLHVNGLVTVAGGDDISIVVTNGDSVDRALTNDAAYTYMHITQE